MKKTNKKRQATQLGYQSLETRSVLSANPIISLDGGTLTIDGTAENDRVIVRFAGNEVRAGYQTNGSAIRYEYFARSEVNDIRFNGGNGDDHFINQTNLSSLAYGNRGNDRLIGGRGNDRLHGGPGDDVLNGWKGDDSLHGDHGDDILSGSFGNDQLYGWFGNDVILGGDGDDYISGYLGNDWAFGGDGDDVLRGHEGNDHLIGGNGDDELYGFVGHDHLYGSDGDDYISGYHGSDFIAGGNGNDVLKGHEGVDRIFGGEGDDLLYGWKGNDLLNGMGGNDEIWGGDGDDRLLGQAGNDILHGDTGNDWINGGIGDDILFGFTGADRLIGGAGHDILCGGFGDDSYADISEGDQGYDPDSLFASGGISRADQRLSDRAGRAYERFMERLSERAAEVAESQQNTTKGDRIGAWLPELDFETDAFDQPLEAGTVISNQWAAWGVNITTNNPDAHPAMIFDSANPTGGDTDLATPDQGNVLIISEDGDSSDPDDNARGGTLIFEFDRAVIIDEISLLDVDTRETTTIRLYDTAGNLIKTVSANGRGDNLQQAIDLSADNVGRMEVDLQRSGAITNVTFCRDGH